MTSREQERYRMASPTATSHSAGTVVSPPAMTHHKSSSMHAAPAKPVLYTQKSADEVVTALADYILLAQKEAVEKKGRFTVALSGGSLPKMLRGLIGKEGVHWDKW